MIAQHYQQISPIEELADQLMKQGIASTKLDAKIMAENMLNKQMHVAKKNEQLSNKPINETPNSHISHPTTPVVDKTLYHTSEEQTIHPHVQKHITQIHSRINEQSKLIEDLKQEINSLKSQVQDYAQKLHEEVGSEMATEIVEEPINYNQEHIQEEQDPRVQADIADELLNVEKRTSKEDAEIAEAEEELSIIPEKKKDDDVDLLNIF